MSDLELTDDATDAERLAYYEGRIERALSSPKTRQTGVRRSDNRPHAVYVCRDMSGSVLYVGISLTAMARFGAHSQGSPWFKNVARIDIEHCANRDSALARELDLIAALSPVYNRAGVPA